MVVFTCTYCGDSLQKPKVEKHYQTVCRTTKSLTCMDCLKDFKGEDYAAHTKCITEEQRYSAKGGDNKPTVKKGEAKQESWTEIIQAVVLNANNVNGTQRRILEVMQGSVNVPRKKNKFTNFIRSAVTRASENDINAVWNLVEQHKNLQKPTAQNVEDEKPNSEVVESGKSKKKKQKLAENEVTEESVVDETVVNGKSKKAKRKLEENKAADGSVEGETVTFNGGNDGELGDSKSKKKKQNVGDTEVQNASETLNGKSKKKKQKVADESTEISKCDAGVTEIVNENPRESNAADVEPAAKKKKQKQLETPKGDAPADTHNGKQKKKKQKQLRDETANCDKPAEVPAEPLKEKKATEAIESTHKRKNEDASDEPTEKKPKNDDNFSYKDEIVKILTSKSSVALEKVQKKVLRVFEKRFGHEASAKTIKHFNKTVKKICNVDKDNIVTLIVS